MLKGFLSDVESMKAKIIKVDGQRLIVEIQEPFKEELIKKQAESVEIHIDDNRRISDEQRKKIFAIIRDIYRFSGHEPEEVRAIMTWYFCEVGGYENFSLSPHSPIALDMTGAREFINYLIEFCFNFNIPTRDTLLNRTDDLKQYLYLCLKYRKCAICNSKADVHHIDAVGMGRNRKKIVHYGMKVIALCRNHHNEAHSKGKTFLEENHLIGIGLDKYLCEKLNLKAGEDYVE